MKKKQTVGMIIAAILLVFIGVTSVLTHAMTKKMFEAGVEETLLGGSKFAPPSTEYIGVVKVEGSILPQQEETFSSVMGYQHKDTVEYVEKLKGDGKNKGILLYVDSPGGTVYESEELYLKLLEYKETTGRPVWVYMSHLAASGGYMISMSADKIYANSNTITGSIGVIFSRYDMSGLYDKLGIKNVNITSGENKDSSKITDSQIEIFQGIVDEYYERFVEIVMLGRNMTEEEVKALADGRVYTAKQAKENRLIDEISGFEEMKLAMETEFGVNVFYELERKTSPFASVFGKVKSLFPKSEAQILLEAAEQIESGVPMYYAEPLQ